MYFVVQACSAIIYPMATRDASTERAQGRPRLAQLVRERRLQLGLSVRAAADRGGLARGTWIGLEEGTRRTADNNYAAIEHALKWTAGSIGRILNGGEPTLTDTDPGEAAEAVAPTSERDQLIIKIMARKDISDDDKHKIAELLIAQKEAAERAREESARRLVDMLRRDPNN